MNKPEQQPMKSNPATDTMKRGEFLRSLGLSSATLMAVYCMGTTLSSCSKSSDDPAPSTGTTTPVPSTGLTGNADLSKGAINFTLNLADTNFSKLKTAGQYVLVGNLIVAQTAAGQYVALSKTCTHEGTDVQYRSAQNDFFCPNHGSEFSTTGTVEVGPAARALTQYKTTLSTDKNSLTVTA